VPFHHPVEDEVIHPDDARHRTLRSPTQLTLPQRRRVAQQAQHDAVEQPARRLLARMRDRPARDSAVEEVWETVVDALHSYNPKAKDQLASATRERVDVTSGIRH
jgi:hypothetical protein